MIKEFTRIPPCAPEQVADLSTRELEVFRLIARGLSNAEIGQELHIGENTVKTHVTHILQKLDLRDRVQAVVLAYQTGMFGPDAPDRALPRRPTSIELRAARMFSRVGRRERF